MHELIVPADLARLQIEGNDGVVEQVVAGAQLAAPLRHRVAGFEVDQPQPGVDRRRRPQCAAPVFPDVAVSRPRLMAVLTGAWNHFEVPETSARLRIEAERAPPREVVAARHDRDDDAVAVGGGGADALRRDVGITFVAPDDLAGLLADRDDARITQPREQQAVADADAAAAAEWRLRLEDPQRLSGCRIEREDLASRRHDEHPPAGDQDRRLRDLPIGKLDRPRP